MGSLNAGKAFLKQGIGVKLDICETRRRRREEEKLFALVDRTGYIRPVSGF
jgi:hypothetical protein